MLSHPTHGTIMLFSKCALTPCRMVSGSSVFPGPLVKQQLWRVFLVASPKDLMAAL